MATFCQFHDVSECTVRSFTTTVLPCVVVANSKHSTTLDKASSNTGEGVGAAVKSSHRFNAAGCYVLTGTPNTTTRRTTMPRKKGSTTATPWSKEDMPSKRRYSSQAPNPTHRNGKLLLGKHTKKTYLPPPSNQTMI